MDGTRQDNLAGHLCLDDATAYRLRVDGFDLQMRSQILLDVLLPNGTEFVSDFVSCLRVKENSDKIIMVESGRASIQDRFRRPARADVEDILGIARIDQRTQKQRSGREIEDNNLLLGLGLH